MASSMEKKCFNLLAGTCTDTMAIVSPTGRNPFSLCGTLSGDHSKYLFYNWTLSSTNLKFLGTKHSLKNNDKLACHQLMSKSINCQLDGKGLSYRPQLYGKDLFHRVDIIFMLFMIFPPVFLTVSLRVKIHFCISRMMII